MAAFCSNALSRNQFPLNLNKQVMNQIISLFDYGGAYFKKELKKMAALNPEAEKSLAFKR